MLKRMPLKSRKNRWTNPSDIYSKKLKYMLKRRYRAMSDSNQGTLEKFYEEWEKLGGLREFLHRAERDFSDALDMTERCLPVKDIFDVIQRAHTFIDIISKTYSSIASQSFPISVNALETYLKKLSEDTDILYSFLEKRTSKDIHLMELRICENEELRSYIINFITRINADIRGFIEAINTLRDMIAGEIFRRGGRPPPPPPPPPPQLLSVGSFHYRVVSTPVVFILGRCDPADPSEPSRLCVKDEGGQTLYLFNDIECLWGCPRDDAPEGCTHRKHAEIRVEGNAVRIRKLGTFPIYECTAAGLREVDSLELRPGQRALISLAGLRRLGARGERYTVHGEGRATALPCIEVSVS